MGTVIKKVGRPVLSVSKDSTVLEAVRTMAERSVGSAVVLENGRAVGIFSERDVMVRVTARGLDAARTPVSAVMSAPVLTVTPETEDQVAIRMMQERHIRHLPVADSEGHVIGMLSMRHLMGERIDELDHELGALDAYMRYDGATG